MAIGLLLDISGVLYNGTQVISGAKEAVVRCRANEIPIRFLTNTTRRPKRLIVERLNHFGFAVETNEVITPSQATCDWLNENGYSPHLLEHPDLTEDFDSVVSGNPIAVVVGDAGPFFDFENLNAAFRDLNQGAPFLALAANRVFRDVDGELSLDAGAFVHGLEYAAQVEAQVLGKPSTTFFRAAADSMKLPLAEVIMIGDDAENDIAGALKAGAGKTILVRTGKYRAGEEKRYSPPPSFVADDISEAVDLAMQMIAQ
ncbi:TIGR01458 family HAD-type hydrolase [Ruegeria hyattellae]|uniref:TIGR01458 family HAD-type hydrolase n=1 Tax=Ruegeria hyattellae TaxID=3233337 RepID=UPI00355BADC0